MHVHTQKIHIHTRSLYHLQELCDEVIYAVDDAQTVPLIGFRVLQNLELVGHGQGPIPVNIQKCKNTYLHGEGQCNTRGCVYVDVYTRAHEYIRTYTQASIRTYYTRSQ